jgi:PTH1 family peptidyl-tRNA hydrolase
MESLHLIVGLGNPGGDYALTRHNAGFMVVERLAQRWRARWELSRKFEARLADARVGSQRVVLCQPLTFMNASGECVRPLMDYRSILIERLLVSADDADLPLGELRLRPKGGTGGHHGLESLVQHLGGQEFARQRIGIGRRAGAREITNHVLGRFGPDESEVLETVLQAAADQAESWLTAGVQKAMNQFNGSVLDPANAGTQT